MRCGSRDLEIRDGAISCWRFFEEWDIVFDGGGSGRLPHQGVLVITSVEQLMLDGFLVTLLGHGICLL